MPAFRNGLAGLAVAAACLGASGSAQAISSSFVALLYGGNVIAETDGKANTGQRSGYGLVSISFPTERRMCYSIYTVSIDKPVVAVIANAPSGLNGPNVAVLRSLPSGQGAGIASACIRVKPDVAKSIRSRPSDHYVIVRTRKFPRGAIRGQLL